MRKCHWCGKKYDPKTESSVWCEMNPNRGRRANRRKPRIFSTRVMIAPMFSGNATDSNRYGKFFVDNTTISKENV